MAKKKKKKKPKKKKPQVTQVAGCPARWGPCGGSESPAGREESFYFVDAEIEEEVSRPHLASVTLAPEQVLPPWLVISAHLIQDELAAYIGDFRDVEFTWEVTETAPLVFSVPFPSVELLRVCSHDFIRCPINKFLISVRAATAEPELVPPLEKIDGLSLIFYFGSRGRRLTFELESSAVIDLHSLAPGASVLGDDRREGDGGSSEESSFCEEDVGIGGVPPAASDGRRTPSSTAVGPSSSAGVASRVASGIEPVIIAGSSPVVIDLVVQDGVEVQGGSSPVATTADDLEFTEADVLSVGMEVCPSSSPCSPGVVCYSRSTGSPSLALGSPDRVPPPPLDLVISVVTPKAADSKARGEVSPVVSER
ncbi:hypothetical protein ZWY2020_037024 [Hordeum vulgare]|nr:hypothetical protein ZWY2020_037024 [Hordeum vulgare]